MKEKTAKHYVGLVNYQELESNILSSIREGTYRNGSFEPQVVRKRQTS